MALPRKGVAAAVRIVALSAFLPLLLQGCFPYTSGYKPDSSARKSYMRVDPAAPSERSVELSIESLPAAKDGQLSPLKVKGIRKVTGTALKVTENTEQRYRNYWSPAAIPIGIIGIAEIPIIVIIAPIVDHGKQDNEFHLMGGNNPKECEPNNFISAVFMMSVGHIPTCEPVGEPKVSEEVTAAGMTITEDLPLAEFPLRVRLLADGSPLPEGKGVRRILTQKDGRATVPLSPLVADLPDTVRAVEVEVSAEGEAASAKAPLPGAVVEALLGPVRELRRGDEAAGAGSGLVALEHYSRAFGLAREDADRSASFEKVATTYRGLPIKPPVPEEVRRLLVQAEALGKENEVSRSKQKLEEAIRVAPWVPSAWNNLAVARAMENDYGGAIRSMGMYLRLAPDGPEARKAKDLVYQWETLVPAGAAAEGAPPEGGSSSGNRRGR